MSFVFISKRRMCYDPHALLISFIHAANHNM
ncbi:hypothetical protein [Bacillus phage vB_BceS-M2]